MFLFSDRQSIRLSVRDRLQFDDVTGTTLLHIRSICDDRGNGRKVTNFSIRVLPRRIQVFFQRSAHVG